MINAVCRYSVAVVTLMGLATGFAQLSVYPPAPPLVSPIEGAIDFHVHSSPDVFGRSMDDIEVARLAKHKGMRAIVLKNHVTSTADRAMIVNQVVPGIEVFGGIVLNRAVGGVNVHAVSGCIACPAGAAKWCGCRPSKPTIILKPLAA